MDESYTFLANNVEETIELASKFAKYLQSGDIITLEGDLGAGKTSFTKGIAKGLEISKVVNSPTFTIIKEYTGRLPLYHMDVYRLEGDVEDLGFDDYFYGDGITVIEWALIIKDYLPPAYLNIKIEKLEDDKRKINFLPFGNRYIELCKEFIKNENFSN